MLATRTSRWSAVTAAICLLLFVATWFLLVSPKRADVTRINEERVSAEDANLTLERRIADLRKQYGDLEARRAELAAIRAQMPPAADVPDLVRNLSTLASDAGVELLSVAPGTPRILDEGLPAVASIPVTVEASGGYAEDALYLKYLQTKLSRVFLITNVSVSRGEAAAATTASPTTTGTATSTATPTASPTPTATATATATATTSPTAASNEFSLSITGEVYALLPEGFDAITATATPTPAATGAVPSPTATP